MCWRQLSEIARLRGGVLMTGGRTAVISRMSGIETLESDGGLIGAAAEANPNIDPNADAAPELGGRLPLNDELPTPLIDDVAALAGLMHARMQLRSMVTGEQFTYREAHALAASLLPGRRVSYERLQSVLGCERAQVRNLMQYLSRVGLVDDSGSSAALIRRPVQLEVFVGTGGDNWRQIAPGTLPYVTPGHRVRIVASSHLALELRVFRVFHRTDGGTAMRSITMKSMSRGRSAVVELELDDAGEGPGIEQILMHVAWSTMSLGDWDLHEAPCTGTPSNLSESVQRERYELCHSAGLGWVAEYLFPYSL